MRARAAADDASFERQLQKKTFVPATDRVIHELVATSRSRSGDHPLRDMVDAYMGPPDEPPDRSARYEPTMSFSTRAYKAPRA